MLPIPLSLTWILSLTYNQITMRYVKIFMVGLGLFFSGILSSSHALFEWRNTGAEALGFSEGYTAVARGVEAIPFNPAGLADTKSYSARASYIPIYGGLDVGLRSADFSTAYAFPVFVIGFRAQDVGADLGDESGGRYAEETFTLSLARYLNNNLRAGLNLNAYHLQFPNPFGSGTSFGADLGILADIYTRWRFGFMLENLNHGSMKTKEGKEPLPEALCIGLSFIPFEDAATVFDIRKEPDYPARFAFAQEIAFWSKRLRIRGGILSEGERFRWTAGAGFSLLNLTLDYAAIFDPNLPLTHAFGLKYGR